MLKTNTATRDLKDRLFEGHVLCIIIKALLNEKMV